MADLPLNDEFSLIESIQSVLQPSGCRVKIGIGDDAALIALNHSNLLVSTDLFIEQVHFRQDWSKPSEFVRKAWIANLSDINAMGGQPISIVLGLGLPRESSLEFREEIIKAIGEVSAEFEVELVGGDIVASPQITLAITVLGEPGERVLTRSAAEPGQSLFLSGSIGASRAGLELLSAGEKGCSGHEWVKNHLRGSFPDRLGYWLAAHTATTACIDISDGLFSEAHHLAKSSRVRIVIDEEALPLADGLNEWALKRGYDPTIYAGGSGEEYQLLFTCASPLDEDEAIFPHMPSHWQVRRIGVVEQGEGVVLNRADGTRESLLATGWNHFR